MGDFVRWFDSAMTASSRNTVTPHPWPTSFASRSKCSNRLIHIPTGMGKTLGVLLACTYHRLHRNDSTWPNRLIWCLPIRTLVEQTSVGEKKLSEIES